VTVRSRDRGRRWSGVSLVAVLLLVGSALPLPRRLNPDLGPYGPDKLLHLLGHACFTAALVAAVDDDGSARVAVVAIVASTVYGVCTELLQEIVPGRAFERGDVVAGLVGSIVGVAGWRRVASRSRRE